MVKVKKSKNKWRMGKKKKRERYFGLFLKKVGFLQLFVRDLCSSLHTLRNDNISIKKRIKIPLKIQLKNESKF